MNPQTDPGDLRHAHRATTPPPELDSADFEPDTARSWERADPFKETGHDRLDCPDCPPVRQPDQMIRAVHNAHESHQLNSESAVQAGEANRLD